MQNTLKSPVIFDGVGLHTGTAVRMVVRPASAGHGIWFRRTDIQLGNALVPAQWDVVERSPLCTKLVNASGVSVSTVEHVMAALAGCGIHNALVEINGPEVPVLDGSSIRFVRGLVAAGLRDMDAPIAVIEITRAIQVVQGDAVACLSPATGVSMSFEIDFPDAAIGHQQKSLDLSNGAFVRELSDSRTFCRRADVEAMQAAGLALGGTYDNAVVVDGPRVLSTGGLRHPDEAVRHKMLDALGDLATAGMPILGHYRGQKAGHALTNKLLRALFATPDAWRIRTADAQLADRLPGAGLGQTDLEAVA